MGLDRLKKHRHREKYLKIQGFRKNKNIEQQQMTQAPREKSRFRAILFLSTRNQ